MPIGPPSFGCGNVRFHSVPTASVLMHRRQVPAGRTEWRCRSPGRPKSSPSRATQTRRWPVSAHAGTSERQDPHLAAAPRSRTAARTRGPCSGRRTFRIRSRSSSRPSHQRRSRRFEGGHGWHFSENSFTHSTEENKEQLDELIYQMLETERGGIQVYTAALTCVQNDELKEEWEEYLDQTENHERIVLALMEQLGMDPEKETPGRQVVRHIGESLVRAMELAKQSGPPEAAELVACECIVEAETKDHLNWELLGLASRAAKGEQAKALKDAHEEVEEEEDEHLYHTTGWCRELWIQSLGMPAVLPPPEEEKEVKTAIGAARAKQARREML